jgi:hypothetical protein
MGSSPVSPVCSLDCGNGDKDEQQRVETCWPSAIPGSPKDSIPQIYSRREACWIRWRERLMGVCATGDDQNAERFEERYVLSIIRPLLEVQA